MINTLKELPQRLDEKQMNIALGKLNDKIEHENIRIKCIQLMKEISKKCNQQRLNDMCKLLGTIAVKLDEKHICKLTLSKKWNENQLNIAFQCLIGRFQIINGYCCDTSRDLLE
ncbi:hypothetical protein RFI_39330 [Reticulomyxa filosa]|uniref:Uncharacterized protein n=1 Tax=Reticulomyxa filosa TaxID=46433 RepID=X6LBR3_RETFI|nr:hypothetical protein RFI_39330 [Reticulomyxa filosa]|eukprot:ETN98184.1 hypothetical protein RFI_39330 [Reticulomyxa filosa]